ncbi:MAG: P-loop NTPase fold protein [Clostridia bacterium]
MEDLVDSICDYVRKPYTDYAVMLNGEWGSGKTYFWNNKLRSRLEAIKVNGKKYKTIYMSLYGINSLEEISKKIFIETNPMISKTLKKFVDTRQGNLIPEYVKTGLDMANLFGNMNFNSDKLDFSKLFSIDDKILCFDDLERANVDVIDILRLYK